MLDQTSKKRSSIKKDVFIKGRQEKLDGVISFVANIVINTRFWVIISPTNTNAHPYIIHLLVEIIDYSSSVEFVSLNEKYRQSNLFMPHTLITYIFNFFLFLSRW